MADVVKIDAITDLSGNPFVGVSVLFEYSGGPFSSFQGFRRSVGGQERPCGAPVAARGGPGNHQTELFPAAGQNDQPGNYFWKVKGLSGSAVLADSGESFACASPAEYSAHSACIDSIQRLLVAMTVTAVGEKVYTRKSFETEAVVRFPCMVLSVDDEQEREMGGTMNTTDWGFPVKCEFVTAQHSSPVLDEQYLYWRERVRSLHMQRLPDVPGSWKTLFEPRWVVRYRKDKLVYMTSLAVLRCVVRRGS